MARLPQGILGGVLGKVGNVVGSSWKGIPILKSRPLSVANPRTTAQVAQRTKMANVVKFSQGILSSVIKPLNDRFAQGASGYNDFVGRNIHLFSTTVPTPAVNLKISVGKMGATSIVDATPFIADDKIDIEWSPVSTDPFSASTDLAYVVVMNATTEEVEGFATAAERSESGTEVTLSTPISASDVLHVWLAFKRLDGTVVSNTSYKTITA